MREDTKARRRKEYGWTFVRRCEICDKVKQIKFGFSHDTKSRICNLCNKELK